MCFKDVLSHSVMSDSLRPHGLCSPWNSPGQNTRVGSISLLQGIFPTQGSNPGLPHCRRILYQLSHKGSPRILEWVAYPFSSGSSQPSNQTGVLTQESNQGLLHCRQILYHLSHQGSPFMYNNVCILIPISPFIPSPHIPPWLLSCFSCVRLRATS